MIYNFFCEITRHKWSSSTLKGEMCLTCFYQDNESDISPEVIEAFNNWLKP